MACNKYGREVTNSGYSDTVRLFKENHILIAN